MTKPPPTWFGTQGLDTDSAEFLQRKAALLKELPALMDKRRGGRANSFMPYLLVRSMLGDRGDRPINVPFWESPDIWTAPGDPATTRSASRPRRGGDRQPAHHCLCARL